MRTPVEQELFEEVEFELVLEAIKAHSWHLALGAYRPTCEVCELLDRVINTRLFVSAWPRS